MQILRSLSTKNVVLLADLFHMNIEEADIPAAIAARGIGHAAAPSWIPTADPRGWPISTTR